MTETDLLSEATTMLDKAVDESDRRRAFLTLCRCVGKVITYLVEQRIEKDRR